MSVHFKAVLAAFLVSAAPANAVVYDLSAEFSDSANPNGVWSYGTGLTHFAQPSGGAPNDFNGAAGNGYWGVGPDFFAAPFVVKVTANGGSTGAFTDGDFLTGDVIVHAPSDGTPVLIRWTAPDEGTISFSSAFWYAHSIVQRSQDVAVALNGAVLGTVTLTNGDVRSLTETVSGAGIAVSAGDVLSFAFSKTAGQTFGSLSGISASIDFAPAAAPVPEPASWALMIGGLALAGGALRRSRATVRFA